MIGQSATNTIRMNCHVQRLSRKRVQRKYVGSEELFERIEDIVLLFQ
nr:MAG TPA: hypothetical protein [Caudoviricetes sp.]